MTILVCCILALSALTARAADDAGARMVSSVTFVVNGSDIDASYGRNAESLDRIRCFLDSIARDSFPAITSIEYAGYASPEGPAAANVMLARKRMAALEDFVMTACVVPLTEDVSRMYEVKGMSSLAEVIEKSDIAHREEAMKILGDETRSDEVKINRLRRARGGRIWRALVPLLEELRYASVTFNYVSSEEITRLLSGKLIDPVCVTETEEVNEPETEIMASADTVDSNYPPVSVSRRPFYASLKTNALYDLLLIPSVGAEVWLGRMMSVNANWSYAWWSKNRRHNYWRYYGGDIAVRRWFGRKAAEKPLTGHHIGLYAQIMTYDFELGGKGYMGNKYNYGGGVEYGFSLPMARRFNIDFTVGVGYLGGEYYEYTPIDGHYVWQATKQRRWFGPTKAEVSLVWLIGYGNKNKPKGGNRVL